MSIRQYVKSVRIRSYSGMYFPAFELNMERYRVNLRVQSECEKIRTRITPNTDTFHAVYFTHSRRSNITYSAITTFTIKCVTHACG